MKISLLYYLIFASALFVSLEVRANSEESTSQQQNIHHICESSYDLCLSLLPPYLAKTPQYSRLWYAYKLYQLEALFALERDVELEKMLLTVVSRKDLPEKFHIYSHILYAKLIQYKGNTELAERYFNEAKDRLLAVNKEWPKPFEQIKIANMLLYMNQYQIGYDMLIGLDEKFAHFTDATFKYRLYTNLGHFAQRLEDHPTHQEYRLKALQWAEKTDNTNIQAIANFNVARSHFFVESFDIAIKYFNLALALSLKARNQNLVNKSYLNLADIYQRLNNRNNVKVLLKKVKFDELDGAYAKLFTKLSNDK
jgi:tetratricopeptide (TPR) repeat protein